MRGLRVLLCVALCLAVLPVGAGAVSSTGTIRGTVTNSVTGQPAAGQWVVPYTLRGGEWIADFDHEALCDGAGMYSLDLAPGTYRVGISAQYSTPGFFGGVSTVASATSIPLSAGRIVTADFSAEVAPLDGTVRGTVTAAASGAPLSRITVELHRVNSDGTIQGPDETGWTGGTDANGLFDITGVARGNYKIRFADWNSGVYETRWFGGFTRSTATTVAVDSATPLTRDIALAAGGSMNGTLTVTPAFTDRVMGSSSCRVDLFRQDGSDWQLMDDGYVSFSGMSDDGPLDGSFRVSRLPAGTYVVRMGGSDTCGRFCPDVAVTDPSDPALTRFTVTPGSSTDVGIHTLPRAGDIRVTVVDRRGMPVSLAILNAYRPGAGADYADTAFANMTWLDQGELAAPGASTMTGLLWGAMPSVVATTTGSFKVQVVWTSPLPGTAFKSVWYGGAPDYATASIVHVNDGRTTPIRIVVDYLKPFATLGTPVMPSAVTHGHRATISGTLSPKHTSGTRAVTLHFYRLIGGQWIEQYLLGDAPLKVTTSGTHSKYSVTLTIRTKGKWRVQAYHQDAGHAPSWSTAKSFTVK